MNINSEENYIDIINKFIKSDNISKNYPWISCKLSDHNKNCGWKIHISSNSNSSVQLLNLIIPLLLKENVSFKTIFDKSSLLGLNQGEFGATQIGKFMTIFPNRDEQALELSKELIEITKKYSGPKIITDYYLGGTVYTRFGSFSPYFRRNRLGSLIKYIKTESGVTLGDDYTIPYKHPDSVENIFENLIVQNQTEDKRDKIIGPGYLLIDIIQNGASGFVYLALDLKTFGEIKLVIIKEGLKLSAEDRFSRYSTDRLSYEYEAYKKLHNFDSSPSAYDLFEEDGNLYLVIEYIGGILLKDLYTTKPFIKWNTDEKLRKIDIISNICSKVSSLHEHGFIHRDLTPNNIKIEPNGKIYFLDFELSWEIDSKNIPFTQGTPGFVSPQQVNNDTPDKTDDIYSIGGIMAWFFASIDPQRLIANNKFSTLDKKIKSLSGLDQSMSTMIANCLSPKKELRPNIKEIKNALRIEKEKTTKHSPLISTESINIDKSRSAIRKLLQRITNSMNDLPKDSRTGLWLSTEDDGHLNSTKRSKFELLRSPYRGVSGSLYLFSRLSKIGVNISDYGSLIDNSIDWLLAQESTKDCQMPGLYFGETGVAVAITQLFSEKILNRNEEQWIDDYLLEITKVPYDWPDITHGASGRGIGYLNFADQLNDEKWIFYAEEAANYLLESQEEDGYWIMPDGASGMTGEVYTGFAHGNAGIIYFLLELFSKTSDSNLHTAANKAFDWLISKMIIDEKHKTVKWYVSDKSNDSWHSWCHGAPGITLALLKHYEVTKDDSYLHIIDKILNTYSNEYSRNNLSTCCGLSGIGEVFIEAYKITKNIKWLQTSSNIANDLLALSEEHGSNSIMWSTVKPQSRTADLMVGQGGIIHFLLRFLDPDSFSFPLLR